MTTKDTRILPIEPDRSRDEALRQYRIKIDTMIQVWEDIYTRVKELPLTPEQLDMLRDILTSQIHQTREALDAIIPNLQQ